MKSIDTMYFNGVFNSTGEKDPLFQYDKEGEKDILAPIDKMSKQIFASKPN